MLYRILTEHTPESHAVIQEALAHEGFDSYTVITATGYWKGAQEKSLIIEISAEDTDLVAIHRAAKKIKLVLHQEAVLIQRIECDAVLV